jgi:hypothetical protein
VFDVVCGRLAQMVERPLRMREVGGSIPPMSNFSHLFQRHDLLYVYHTLYSTYTKFNPKILPFNTPTYIQLHIGGTACLCTSISILYRLRSSQHDTKIPTNADIRIYFPCSNHRYFVCYTYALYTPRTCAIVFIFYELLA